MLPFHFQKNNRFLIMGICGSIMAIGGFLIYNFNPLELIINAVAVIAPNTVMFKIWTKPPYEVLINLYIFNVTNPEEFIRDKAKLRLEQVGPYAYQEILTNGNPRFNPNGTVTFEPKRELIFRRDKSVGDPKTDKILSPNIPLLGITSSLEDTFFANIAVVQIANILNSKPFVELTIDEYLWGYDDKLVTLANQVIPTWINFPRFGIMDRLMALDNASNIVTIKTSDGAKSENILLTEKEKEWPYTITTFNGSPGLRQWGYVDSPNPNSLKNNTRCNTIEGAFEGGVFPTELEEDSTLRVYRRAFCRPVDFKFEKYSNFNGFDSVDFRIDQLFLGTPEENPDNACYCFKGKCPKKGTGYLTPCYYEIPVVISQPHFLNAPPELINQTIGMAPNKELHDATMTIHRILGVPLHAKLRVQINLEVNTKYSTVCRPFNGLILPLFWIDLTIDDVPFSVKFYCKLLYSILPVVQTVTMYFFILFGTALVAAAALLTIYGTPNHGLEDPYENRIGYVPIRIIPMTNYLTPPTIRINK